MSIFNIPAIFTHHLKKLSVMQHILFESEEYGEWYCPLPPVHDQAATGKKKFALLIDCMTGEST